MRNTLEYPVTHVERLRVLQRLHDQALSHIAPVGNIDAMVLEQCMVLLSAQHAAIPPPPDPHRQE